MSQGAAAPGLLKTPSLDSAPKPAGTSHALHHLALLGTGSSSRVTQGNSTYTVSLTISPFPLSHPDRTRSGPPRPSLHLAPFHFWSPVLEPQQPSPPHSSAPNVHALASSLHLPRQLPLLPTDLELGASATQRFW